MLLVRASLESASEHIAPQAARYDEVVGKGRALALFSLPYSVTQDIHPYIHLFISTIY
jgi:hypothetical protein